MTAGHDGAYVYQTNKIFYGTTADAAFVLDGKSNGEILSFLGYIIFCSFSPVQHPIQPNSS